MAAQLISYQAAIIRLYRDYPGKAWLAYDRAFRQKMAASQFPACVQEIKTPLKWSAWNWYLRGHQNRVWVDCLLRGITNGVKVGFDGRKVRSARKNLPSASEKPEVIRDYIGKELKKGNISGPWPREVLPQLIANRFGVIPKSNGKWRLIVDLSFPEGCSVNEGIDKSLMGMVYSSVVDAAHVLLRLGKGALLAKVDMASTYRIIPVHPEDRMLWVCLGKTKFM